MTHDNGTAAKTADYNLLVTLYHEGEINEPWLENQAIAIEAAILERCPHAPGSSVTANFQQNGFELDLTIVAGSMIEFYDRLGQVMRIVEETAEIDLNGMVDEVRSGFESTLPPEIHDAKELTPA